jgi:hypothetical protein
MNHHATRENLREYPCFTIFSPTLKEKGIKVILGHKD